MENGGGEDCKRFSEFIRIFLILIKDRIARRQIYIFNTMKILLITPDLTCTGAAIELLQLAKFFLKDNNEVIMVGREGDLSSEFIKIGAKIPPQDVSILSTSYDLYVANTLLSLQLLMDFKIPLEKTVAWIHETSDRFAIDGVIASSLSKIKYAIFPAKFQLEDYKKLMPNCDLYHLNNCVSTDRVFVHSTSTSYVTTGYWDVNKNQEFITNTIQNFNLGITVNFVGADRPNNVYASSHNFWGRVSMLTAKQLIANSRGYISASLTEVQPLSLIESLMFGLPVLVSNIPAHKEFKDIFPEIVLFKNNDANSFCQGYLEVLEQNKNTARLEKNRLLANELFGWSKFEDQCGKIFSCIIN